MFAGDDHRQSLAEPSSLSQGVAKWYLSPILVGSLPCAVGGRYRGGKGGAPTYPGGFKTLRDASVIFGVWRALKNYSYNPLPREGISIISHVELALGDRFFSTRTPGNLLSGEMTIENIWTSDGSRFKNGSDIIHHLQAMTVMMMVVIMMIVGLGGS